MTHPPAYMWSNIVPQTTANNIWTFHDQRLPGSGQHSVRNIMCSPWISDRYIRTDSRFAPSQWGTALLCNDASHWLGASLELVLYIFMHLYCICININRCMVRWVVNLFTAVCCLLLASLKSHHSTPWRQEETSTRRISQRSENIIVLIRMY